MVLVFRRLTVIAAMTLCALLYVAQQNEIFHVSFSIHKKNQSLVQFQDRFERLNVRVFRLKALDILENRVEAAKMGLTIPSEVKTLQVAVSQPQVAPISIESGNSAFSLLQFVKEAHAKIAPPDKD